MSTEEGRAVGEALLDHPEHELYDPATPGELALLERLLRVTLPPSFRALLEVGSGGILATGDLLLGTKDPDQLGATLHEVARPLWEEGLDRTLLPFLDGAQLCCLDLAAADEAGEAEVVEVDPEELRVVRRLGPLPQFLRQLAGV